MFVYQKVSVETAKSSNTKGCATTLVARTYSDSANGQPLNFKLLGTTYLIGKIEFKLLFHGALAE